MVECPSRAFSCPRRAARIRTRNLQLLQFRHIDQAELFRDWEHADDCDLTSWLPSWATSINLLRMLSASRCCLVPPVLHGSNPLLAQARCDNPTGRSGRAFEVLPTGALCFRILPRDVAGPETVWERLVMSPRGFLARSVELQLVVRLRKPTSGPDEFSGASSNTSMSESATVRPCL